MDKKPYKNIGLYLFFLGTIAGVLLIVGVLASNVAASNTAVEDPGVLYEGFGTNLLSHGGSLDGCMVERFNQTKPASVESLNCTANDIELAQFERINGPTSCIEGEDITVTLKGKFVSTANERWDVGLFIATDGGDPNSLGGSCYNDYLHPVSTDNSDLDLTGGSGPFYNGEINEDPGDTCGDIAQSTTAFFQTAQITIQCQDSDDDGNADVNSCTVWANSRSDGTEGKPSCTSELDTTAETTAKCSCGSVEIGGLSVPLNGTIEVIKEVDPADAPGKFNLQIDGVTEFVDAQDGDSTGAVSVSAGFSTDITIGDTHNVGEIAGTGTFLNLYDTVIFCEDQEGDSESAQGAGPLDVFVEPNDAWVCRIINTYNVTPTATNTATPTDTATPTNTFTFTPTPTDTPTPTATEPGAILPATNTPTPTETSPPSTKQPTKTPTPTATSRPPSATSTPVATLAQPTSPAETPQIIIPETGLDLSLSSGNSGFNVLTILMLGLGFVGTGLMFYGISTQISRKRPKK